LREAAATNPGYDVDEVERSYLHALGYDNVDTLYPGQKLKPMTSLTQPPSFIEAWRTIPK